LEGCDEWVQDSRLVGLMHVPAGWWGGGGDQKQTHASQQRQHLPKQLVQQQEQLMAKLMAQDS
jgi:hypothetical protein